MEDEMNRRTPAALAIAAALLVAASAQAAEEEAKKDAAADAAEGKDGGAPEAGPKAYVFVTGLDFSYWAANVGQTVWGPGLTVGFVLVPRHLEMGVTAGAMLGGHQYTIPVELAFTVPFHVNDWFAPYVKLGPTIFTDKLQDQTTYDVAASFGAGIEILPVGYDWGIYAGGDYNVRTMHGVRHQGGFTIGFHYRV
jgi:hypothetical protein